MPSGAALTIADKISDPMMPELDPSLLDFRPMDIDFSSKKDDPLNWNSQVVSEPLSIEIGRNEPAREEREPFDEDDMNIDLDLDIGDDGPSIEIGRRAPPAGNMDDDVMGDDEMFPKDLGFDETQTRASSQVPSLIEDREDDLAGDDGMPMGDDDIFAMPGDDDAAPVAPTDPRLQRASQSPLSSLLEDDEEEASTRQAKHKVKKRKILQPDSDTMLSSAQIKAQQADRAAILKPPSFLPHDPILLNLMTMQKNGEFVSRIMGDGRAKGWAPELRGILSVEVVRSAGERKRKRDSGVADVESDEAAAKIPQLEIPEDDTFGIHNEGLGGDGEAAAPPRDQSIIDLPANDDGGYLNIPDDNNEPRDNFDDTTAPLLHPMEQGAVSLGTKHAVHLLRDRFGSSDANSGSPSQQKKASILFQEILPEQTTSKADATKMFFEVLVLATKDAVKVEQKDEEVGSALRIRAKRGLWGAWAEREAGGEIEEQEEGERDAVAGS